MGLLVNTDAAICFGTEHQLRLRQLVGDRPQWTYSHPGRLLLGDRQLECEAQILGTVHTGQWTWAWSDPSLPRRTTTPARTTKTFGHDHGITAFTTADLPVPTSDVADQIVTASKAVHHRWTSFSFDSTPGWTVYATVAHPSLDLPPATSTTVLETVLTSASGMHDPAAALTWYARQRDLGHEQNGHITALTVTDTDGVRRYIHVTISESTIRDIVVTEQEKTPS